MRWLVALLAVATTNPSQITYSVTGGVKLPLADKLSSVVSVREYCGTTPPADATTCVQNAINTGKTVRGVPGDTYVVGPLTVGTVGQVIDMTGATMKLKAAASTPTILTVNAAGVRVTGGTWDLNITGNASGDMFAYGAVAIAADRVTVDGLYVINSWGMSIRGKVNINYATVRNCRIEMPASASSGAMGIFFDADAHDTYGNRIIDNQIDTSASTTGLGVYISSASPFTTLLARRWEFRGNEIVGSPSSVNNTVGLTARGVDGLIENNRITGYDIGISADIQFETRIIINGNTVATSGPNGLGIEANGGGTIVTNNRIIGGGTSISCTTAALAGHTLDNMIISGNIATGYATRGLNFAVGSGTTGEHLILSGNTFYSATTTALQAVTLARDAKFALITGNIFRGPGSAVANSRGVQLNEVNSDVRITNNRFAGVERPVSVLSAVATVQDRITFDNNDVSDDIPSAGQAASTMLNLEGTATWGTNVRVMSNYRGTTTAPRDDIFDRVAPSLQWQQNDSFTNPEGNITAKAGSTYIRNGSNGKMFIKEAGSSSTGWATVYTTRFAVPSFSATVSIDSAATEQTITATSGLAFTIANPTSAQTGWRLLITIRNTSGGALGVITWDTLYKLAAWTSPATGFSRSIEFRYDGTNWVQLWQSAADVPN